MEQPRFMISTLDVSQHDDGLTIIHFDNINSRAFSVIQIIHLLYYLFIFKLCVSDVAKAFQMLRHGCSPTKFFSIVFLYLL